MKERDYHNEALKVLIALEGKGVDEQIAIMEKAMKFTGCYDCKDRPIFLGDKFIAYVQDDLSSPIREVEAEVVFVHGRYLVQLGEKHQGGYHVLNELYEFLERNEREKI